VLRVVVVLLLPLLLLDRDGRGAGPTTASTAVQARCVACRLVATPAQVNGISVQGGLGTRSAGIATYRCGGAAAVAEVRAAKRGAVHRVGTEGRLDCKTETLNAGSHVLRQ
jgi:hypothetical protein